MPIHTRAGISNRSPSDARPSDARASVAGAFLGLMTPGARAGMPPPPQEDKPPFGSCIFQHLPELCKFSIKNVVAVLHETILVKAFPAASTHLGLDEIGLRDPKLGA